MKMTILNVRLSVATRQLVDQLGIDLGVCRSEVIRLAVAELASKGAKVKLGEEWLTVPGFENYQASNLGRIRRSVAANGASVGLVRKASVTNSGYLQISLSQDNVHYYEYVHSLVARAFIGVKPSGHYVNHKNGIKTDNAVSNLEYVTPSENQRHAVRTGLKKSGDQDRRCKITFAQICEIRALRKQGLSQGELSCRFGIPQSSISKIVRLKKRVVS